MTYHRLLRWSFEKCFLLPLRWPADEASTIPEEAGDAHVPVWASIGDGTSKQVIGEWDVDFTLLPEWFLCEGHKLANVPWTKEELRPCGADRAKVMRNARPFADWRRQQPQKEVQKPFLEGTSVSVDQYLMYNFGVGKLEKLNQELITSSPRRRSAGCEISTLSQLKKAPSIYYTDGRGFHVR